MTILPRGVTAAKSPKPIVVTTANEYHTPSQKLVIFGSIKGNIKENIIRKKAISSGRFTYLREYDIIRAIGKGEIYELYISGNS